MDRETGFYWILLDGATEWEIAKYNKPNNDWLICGSENYYDFDYPEKINEQRILPPQN